MLLFLFLIGFGLFIGFKVGKKDVEATIVGGLIGFWVALALATTMLFLVPCHQQFEEHEKVEIVALKNRVAVGGSFFLGSGQINSLPYYFFYYKTDDGGVKMGKLLAEDVTIYEEKRSGGYLAKVDKKQTYEIKGWMKWLVPSILRTESLFQRYAIHIPEGSVKSGFVLDINNL